MLDFLKEIEQAHTPTQIAAKLGITRQLYYMIRAGQRSISKKVAVALKREYGVPLEKSLNGVTMCRKEK